jgi:WD40 repeat protein
VPGDSLYVDHECDMAVFPRVTTLILDEHADEVWNLSWNHAGTHLATAGKDRRAIVWKIGVRRTRHVQRASVDSRSLSLRQTRQCENARFTGTSQITRIQSTASHGLWMTRSCSLLPSSRSRCGTLAYVCLA